MLLLPQEHVTVLPDSVRTLSNNNEATEQACSLDEYLQDPLPVTIFFPPWLKLRLNLTLVNALILFYFSFFPDWCLRRRRGEE